jgi:hypothetical protein
VVLMIGPIFALAIQPVGWIPEVREALKARKIKQLQHEKRSITVATQLVRCLWWVAMILLIVSL